MLVRSMACPIMVIIVITLHVLDVRSERTCTELGAHRSSFVQFGATWADWCCLVLLGATWADWCSLVQLGADWCSLVQLGTDWCSLVEVGADWCDLLTFGGSWCSLVQLGLIGATWC